MMTIQGADVNSNRNQCSVGNWFLRILMRESRSKQTWRRCV